MTKNVSEEYKDMIDHQNKRFDLQKLSQYFSIVLNMQTRSFDNFKYNKVKFRYCTLDDFISKNLTFGSNPIESELIASKIGLL